MTRELLLMRHGKSDWSREVDDFHRPLKERGKRDPQRIGVWLAQQGLQPDHLVTSPAVRAFSTAERTVNAMGIESDRICKDRRIYAGDWDNLLATLRDCPAKANRVLLVGHNPGMEQLLARLTGGVVPLPADGKLMPTAALARLAMPDDWGQLDDGCARLLSLTRPDRLPERFPFPSPDGKELRDRPAYYYTQSSVIPYRVQQGEPEILVISSNRKRHFVIPKGIQELGLSPQDSAAKEAREEAGVEGRVGASPVGSYSYEKWGATCTVDVYAMEVTRMLPEAEWEEPHRGRQWMTPELAAKRLKQAALAPLVEELAARLRTT